MEKKQLTVQCGCGRKLTKTSYGSGQVKVSCPRWGSEYEPQVATKLELRQASGGSTSWISQS
jgi:hypothetical protein